jgi:hypothetical protein
MVEDLFKLTLQPVEKYQVAQIPNVPLKLAMIGKKYSGKNSVAKAIASKFNLHIVRMDDLIKEAMQ